MSHEKMCHRPLKPIPKHLPFHEQINYLNRYRRYIIDEIKHVSEKALSEETETGKAELKAYQTELLGEFEKYNDQLDEVVKAFGTFAPVIEVTTTGNEITDAAGGCVSSLIETLSPKLEDGTLAPNPSGARFAVHTESKLSVNGEMKTAHIVGEPYIGSYDWVNGRTDIVGVSVVKSDELELTDAGGTTSQGIKYVRFRKTNSTALMNAIASNRYTIISDGQADKAIRLVASGQLYLYDNDIDLDNPESILVGLEILIATNTSEEQYGEGQEISLNKGHNTFTPESGEVTVTYGVDTKTYIDNKFAELSAALIGG